jgi:hypothetical protein
MRAAVGGRQGELIVSRRPHPYFGRLNRLAEVRMAAAGQSRRVEPTVAPDTEPGILWDRLRASPEGLTEGE